MLAEWSAECSADDPVLVVPWSDPGQQDIRFIDLRENPYDLDQIPEAERYPPLLLALRALNAPRSPVFTAKCDAWPIESSQASETREETTELDYLRLVLDKLPEESASGFSSYIDVLWRERTIFASRHHHEQLLDRISRRAASLDHRYAMLDLVLRPALIDLTVPHEGFAVSLYIKALGHDPEAAETHWAAALKDVTALFRNKALAVS
jgi:hypothetical protein